MDFLPDTVSTHHRKASNVTFTSSHDGYSSFDGTEPDHGSAEYGMVALQPVRSDSISTVASPTHMRVDTASDRSTPYPAKSDTGFPANNVATGDPPLNVSSDSQKSNQENGSITKVELVQDELVDPGPFKLRPFDFSTRRVSRRSRPSEVLMPFLRALVLIGHDRMDEHPLSTIAVTALHDVSQDEEIFDPHLASLSER